MRISDWSSDVCSSDLFRIGLPSTLACRFLISSMLRSDPRNTCRFELTDAAFQRDADQLLRPDGELHGELLHDLAAEAVPHHGAGVLLRPAALAAADLLVLADAPGRRLVLDARLALLVTDDMSWVGAALC